MRSSAEGQIEVQAAEWYQKYHSEDAFDAAEFAAWLAADPRHQEAYDAIAAQNQLLSRLSGAPELASLSGQARAYAETRRKKRQTDIRISRRDLIAAGIGLAGIVGTALYMRGRTQTVRTGLGEQRLVILPDTSRLFVDANSEMEIAFRDDRRSIKLVSGRAHFEVAKDAGRKFVVHALDKSVTALGTAFSVEARHQKVSVVLNEGRIAIAQTHPMQESALISNTVQPGDQVVMSVGTGTPDRVAHVDMALALGWQEGKIVFDDETLADAASRMNDYSTAKVVIEGSDLQNQRMTGLFVAGHTDSFVSAIEKYYAVRVVRSNGEYIIRSAA